MNFAAPWFLLGTLLALAVGVLLVVGGLAATKAFARFGDLAQVKALVTADAAKRRAWKGVLLVLAVALAFLAAAQPQYGKGTKLVPATNIDVVVVLDYSKSMYARDVEPSRIFRAKVEVARLVRDLEGARFAAVAFAGEPMGFPLTADGAAIAQFLRQLDPNDMPVGGTAIARALEQARDLLQRDPKSAEHKRIIILITDGEDLEGDPVATAQSIGAQGTVIHVVLIGGSTNERIPEVGPDGKILGWRKGRDGTPLMTALSPDGEKQLAAIAEAGHGTLVKAAKGTTGIDQIAADLKKQMKSELGEKVETVYADVYFYPLGLAVALLIAEVFVGEARKRVIVRHTPPGATKAQLRLRKALKGASRDGGPSKGPPSPSGAAARSRGAKKEGTRAAS